VFTGAPIADNLIINGKLMPLVAVHHWVMPKACFVTVWLWFMLNGKAYHKLVDYAAWEPILALLNPEQMAMIPPNAYKVYLMDKIFTNIFQEYQHLNLTVEDKRDTFTRVLQSLNPHMELMAA
jgi:hypothetical protein